MNTINPALTSGINGLNNISAPMLQSIANNPAMGLNCSDLSSLSGLLEQYNPNFQNPMSNPLANLSNLGMGNIPGFGSACSPANSMFGGLTGMKDQQQIIKLLMLLLQMLQQQNGNGFNGQQPDASGADGSQQPLGMGSGSCGAPSGGGCGSGSPVGGFGAPSGGGCGGGSPVGGFGAPSGGGFGSSAPVGGSTIASSAPAESASTAPTNASASGKDAVELARKFIGRDSISIKGELPHFTAAGGITNNCADFVSSCLESTGRIKGHHINVKEMEKALKEQGWKLVNKANAQPGDVWISDNAGHVELVAEAGGNKLIGSNGSARQRISEGKPYGNGGRFYHKEDPKTEQNNANATKANTATKPAPAKSAPAKSPAKGGGAKGGGAKATKS